METKPLADHKLEDDDLKLQFNLLMDAIYDIDWEVEEEDIKSQCEALDGRIRLAVTSKPILAKIVSRDLLNWSLLMTACTKLYREWSHPTIKFLIEMNPSALLWPRADAEESPIDAIAEHHIHCVLMPWIAENYSWVLDHEQCCERPPVFKLIRCYADREGDDPCTAATIRQFFKSYPKALTQEDEIMVEGFPAHKILTGWTECEADLFKWMVEQCPESLMKLDCFGNTLLHQACMCLKNGSNEICKYLIAKYPNAVRTTTERDHVLPIHYLVGRCKYQPALEVAKLLLQEYPESCDMAAKGCWKAPSSDPFIWHYLMKEAQEAFQEAVVCTKNSLIKSACVVYNLWSNSCLQVLRAEMDEVIHNDDNEEEGVDYDDDDDNDTDDNDDDDIEDDYDSE